MTEFVFEGGHRGGPDFLQHLDDRQEGMPRQNASLTSGYVGPDGWGGPVVHSAAPVCPAEPDAKVYRMNSHGLVLAGTGIVGEVPHALLYDLLCVGVIPPVDIVLAEAELKKHLNERWGSGRYRVVSDEHGYYDVVVAGTSRPTAGALGQGVVEPEVPNEIRISDTVWLELSCGGPYKVVGRYDHPLGAAVPAHHPHDAPNTFEKIRVTEDLWLCQDAAGMVHILAGGSLTLTPPASRFSKITRAASWCWAKREIVLWAALASLAAALSL